MEIPSLHLPRLKKSDIEYVILVVSSLFTLSGLNSDMVAEDSDMVAEAVRDFFNDFSFFALGIANFRLVSGASLDFEGS